MVRGGDIDGATHGESAKRLQLFAHIENDSQPNRLPEEAVLVLGRPDLPIVGDDPNEFLVLDH